MTNSIRDGATDLYRYFDADGRLLYVGISFSAVARASSHRSAKSWWPDVARMDVEHLRSRSEALSAETRAIRSEHPIHNIIGRVGESSTHLAAWRCEECRRQVGLEEGTGYVQVDACDEWHCLCRDCDDGCERYWIDASRITTMANIEKWTWHLADKNWFDVSSWQYMISKCSTIEGAAPRTYLAYDAWRDERNRRLSGIRRSA